MSTNQESESGKQRTLAQNRSLHLGCRQVAEGLKEKGYTVQAVLELLDNSVEVDWTDELVKKILIHNISKAMFEKESTKDLTTKELKAVWENMNRGIVKTGVSVPFPSMEEEMLKTLTK